MSQVSFKKRKLAERVADKLSQTIRRQGWVSGQKLPTVRDLSLQFEVSPNTAHSAIRLLAERGVVSLQPRQGAFIQSVRATTMRNQLGIVWPNPPDPDFTFNSDDWNGRILHSFEREASELGQYVTMLGYFDSDQFLDRINPMRPLLSGVLTFADPHIFPLLDLLDQWDIPWITINSPNRDAVHNFVVADNQGDCAQLGRRLAESDLRRILVLTFGLSASTSSMGKLLGLYEGFALAGVSAHEIEVIDCGDYREPAGYKAMTQRLQQSLVPQVVFAHGDLLALGVLRACRERGLRVPQEIGVIGATGLAMAQLSHPSLSVMAQPMDEMGRQAARLLIEMSQTESRRLLGRRVAGTFIERESFCFPRL